MKAVVGSSGKLQENLAALTKRVAKKTGKAVFVAGLYIYDRSQELVPIDTLALKESGRYRLMGQGFETVIIVGYGKPGFSKREYSKKERKWVTRVPYNYAVWVHEDTQPPQHHDAGKTFEFQAIPMRAERADIVRAIGVRLASNG